MPRSAHSDAQTSTHTHRHAAARPHGPAATPAGCGVAKGRCSCCCCCWSGASSSHQSLPLLRSKSSPSLSPAEPPPLRSVALRRRRLPKLTRRPPAQPWLRLQLPWRSFPPRATPMAPASKNTRRCTSTRSPARRSSGQRCGAPSSPSPESFFRGRVSAAPLAVPKSLAAEPRWRIAWQPSHKCSGALRWIALGCLRCTG
jgi:hypothetical protein